MPLSTGLSPVSANPLLLSLAIPAADPGDPPLLAALVAAAGPVLRVAPDSTRRPGTSGRKWGKKGY